MENRLERIASEGYEFRFGDYINQGFNFCKDHWGNLALTTLVYFIISGVMNGIEEVSPVFSIVTAFIGTPLFMGFFIIIRNLHQGKSFEMGDLFAGFKDFGELAILVGLYILLFVPLILVGILAFRLSGLSTSFAVGGVGVGMGVVLMVFLLGIIYVSIAASLAPMLIVFFRLKAVEAVKMSFRIINQKWWTVFGFMMVTGLIMALGVVALFVGIFFTFPAMIAAQYFAFADITQLDEESLEHDILDHLVEN